MNHTTVDDKNSVGSWEHQEDIYIEKGLARRDRRDRRDKRDKRDRREENQRGRRFPIMFSLFVEKGSKTQGHLQAPGMDGLAWLSSGSPPKRERHLPRVRSTVHAK
jgi:hypothetical protein